MAAVQCRDTAAARTPERQALAEAIERHEGLNVRLEEAHAKIAALTQRRFTALGEVNEGEESLAKARARAMDLAAGSLDEALKPLKTVRARIADAQEVADLLEPVIAKLRAEAEVLEADANFAERNIDDAVRVVVAAAPETEALARAFAAQVAALAETRAAIWPLQSNVPKHLTPLLDMQPVYGVPRGDGVLAASWRAAVGALATDPDAVLPKP